MWKEFKIGDVLDIRRSNGIFHANAINISDRPFEGSHPYVVRSSKNNGIRGYIKDDEAALNPARTISFAQDTAEMFYQEEAYFTGNNVKVASIKDGTPLNEMSALFIITALRKSMSAFHWGMSFELEKIKDITITLPATETHEPDWNYMQERIAELEQERIAELEQYLIATGLNDYELTEEDKHILATKLTDGGASQSSESGSGCWKEARLFRIGDLFEKKTIKGYPKSKENLIPDESGFYVYGQNILHQYPQKVLLDEKYLQHINPKHPILAYTSSVGEIGMIEEDFYRSGDNGAFQGLIPKWKNSKYETQYILSVLKKQFANFGYSTCMANIVDLMFELPIQTTQDGPIIDVTHTYHPEGYIPDWDFMDKYIHAIEKAVIADVVKYKDEVIANTKIVTQ